MSSLDCRQFIQALEAAGELVRVKDPVDSDLEITELTDRMCKSPGGGKALLFENVRNHSAPVLINALGSDKRMGIALGAPVEDIVARIERLVNLSEIPQGIGAKLRLLGDLAGLAKIPPKTVTSAPCQEVVLKDFKLSDLPILKCWPGDASRFITLPVVFTKDSETGVRNAGMYRMQVLDDRTTGMHWQTQKDGATHADQRKRRGEKVEVAVALGADPATVFSSVAPLPYGVDELLLAGFLRGAPVPVVKCKTVDLEVPAQSEIILEGVVDPADLRVEGPFGDHTGVYTPPECFPAFHIQCITMRHNPIYWTTMVGKPPMEDFYIGRAIERIFLPLLKKQIPELRDMHFPAEGTFNNAVVVSFDKTFPHQAKKIAHAIWGLGQLCFTKCVILVDKDVSPRNLSDVALAVFNNIDPRRDLFVVDGPVDTLNHAAPKRDYGSKLGIDATAKWKEEGYERVWPEPIEMSAEVRERMNGLWARISSSLGK